MDIVLITAGTRTNLLNQTLTSLVENAVDWKKHTLTIVIDGLSEALLNLTEGELGKPPNTWIVNLEKQGASACRNIGAGSIPRYRRQQIVMFSDDDVYYCPKWDQLLEETMEDLPDSAISGHQHPYNLAERKLVWAADPVHGIGSKSRAVDVPLLISSVHMVMTWETWDKVGYFMEPGGPGGGEDYQWCMKAKKYGIGFAVTVPMCAIHCGLTNSRGEKLVGYELMVDQNNLLMAQYGIVGEVQIV